MWQLSVRALCAVMLICGLLTSRVVTAADLIAPESHLVTLLGAPAAKDHAFTIASAQDLVVTLTDLATPKAASSASIVVTKADAIAGSATFAAPASSANFELTGAQGDYVARVIVAPDAAFSVATFSVCVAPKSAPANCIQTASFSDNVTAQSTASDPSVSTLSVPLEVTTSGSYTFTFADLNFPAPLSTPPNLALFQGSTPVPGGLGFPSGTTLTLNVGTYTLLALAQADQSSKSGLYGVTITGPGGAPVLFDDAVPVGLASPAVSLSNSAAQSLILKVSDFGFPSPVSSASALVTAGGVSVGSASAAGGATTITVPAANLRVWSYASAGTESGTYGIDLADSGGGSLYSTARGVNPAGATSFAFAFTTPPVAAGSYKANAADLQFPSTLTGLSFAVAQNGVLLSQSTTAGSLNVTAAAGPVVLLVNAQTPASGSITGSGLFDVNLQSTGAAADLVFDQTQSVGSAPALFDSQTINLGSSGSYDATLTDLEFPSRFENLALVVSRGTEVLGKIFGGGTFSFAATPGKYQVTFIATPAADQQYGLYAIKAVVSPPLVSLAASASTAVTGDSIKLTWSASGADTCTASGGNWTGGKAVTQTEEAVRIDATTTFTLSCSGPGGTSAKSVSVTATPKPASSSGGGGSFDWETLAALLALCLVVGPGKRCVNLFT